MSRSRGRGKNKSESDPDRSAYLRERFISKTAIPGTKIAKQALKSVCTIRGGLSATMIYFYNKRFETNRFAIKIM